MKQLFSILFLFAATASVYAQDLFPFYVGEIETNGDPLALAADSNGGIYYTVFTFAGPDQTRCFYVADPLNGPAPDSHVLVDNAAEDSVPAGRGFTGVAVDSQGNVFLALEIGSNDLATVRKLSPAPAFEPVEEFFGGVVFGGQRYNGVDLINDELLVLSTFGSVEIWSAIDATPLHTLTGLQSFQRDVAYNANADEIYVSRNGADSANSVNLVFGGSPDAIEGFTQFENGYIAQGGVNTAFGVNAQLIEYDPVNNLISVPDYSTDPPSIALYASDDPSAPLANLDGTESPNGGFDSPADSVVVHGGDASYLFVSDNGGQRIVIYSNQSTAVSEWALY